MAASPQVIDAAPLFLTGLQNTYNALHFRKPFGDVIGAGVADYDSFRVRQRAAGANMSVDLQTASVQNRAYVRDSNSGVTDGGLYRVQFDSSTQTNLNIATADATNPRIDSIYLAVEDSQDTGSNSRATGVVVTGTATGGATLDNRTGAGAAPTGMSSILLADILVAAAASSIANAVIRDRRPFAILGAGPSTFTGLDSVAFMVPPPNNGGLNGTIQNTVTADAQQAAALMFLPRRIVSATKIRFRYLQGAAANANNYNIGIYDASGRQIVATGATAYAGALNTVQNASLTITATTFDAGYYWVMLGNAAGTASASVGAISVSQASVSGSEVGITPNLFAFSASGGTTLPTTILGLTDTNTITNSVPTVRIGVPIVALSVG